jgi:hypothetical protein
MELSLFSLSTQSRIVIDSTFRTPMTYFRQFDYAK